MIQASLPQVRYKDGEWTVTQTFIKANGERVTIQGWGWDRASALNRFKSEVAEEENSRPFWEEFTEPFILTIKALQKLFRRLKP